MPAVSVVVLTMGDRSEALAVAIESARSQVGVDVEVVLVVNGGDPDHSLADTVVQPPENLGIPGGRNAGAAAARHSIIAFLDDDARYLSTDIFATTVQKFDADPSLSVVGLAIIDEEGNTSRRHQPRLRGEMTSGPATSFPGGACVVRADAFNAVDGLCAPFVYGLEETDLAWRLLAAGWSIHFAADLQLEHPRTDPSRHADFLHHTARNRVWLAHRSLPLVLALIYVANWLVITSIRHVRQPASIAAYIRGTKEGLSGRIGPRAPIDWATAWRMTRLGRPPIL